MQVTRQRVLLALHQAGQATVNELAEAVGVKSITIRHHLIGLRADGLVELDMRHQGVGRPLHIFSLTQAASIHVSGNDNTL